MEHERDGLRPWEWLVLTFVWWYPYLFCIGVRHWILTLIFEIVLILQDDFAFKGHLMRWDLQVTAVAYYLSHKVRIVLTVISLPFSQFLLSQHLYRWLNLPEPLYHLITLPIPIKFNRNNSYHWRNTMIPTLKVYKLSSYIYLWQYSNPNQVHNNVLGCILHTVTI